MGKWSLKEIASLIKLPWLIITELVDMPLSPSLFTIHPLFQIVAATNYQ
jgi:hypothetical protein